MMFSATGIATVLIVWWLCGMFNTALIQSLFGDKEFSEYNRNQTLWLCFGMGAILTLIFAGIALFYVPVKLGTRWGCYIGRRFQQY